MSASDDAIENETREEHTATYVSSEKYPNLFTALCSCGESSFGASLRTSAESGQARHAANPLRSVYRDRETTALLFAEELQTTGDKSARLSDLVSEYDKLRADYAALPVAKQYSEAVHERYVDAVFTFAHDVANLIR